MSGIGSFSVFGASAEILPDWVGEIERDFLFGKEKKHLLEYGIICRRLDCSKYCIHLDFVLLFSGLMFFFGGGIANDLSIRLQ